MSSKINEAIEALTEELNKLHQRAVEIKKTINQLYVVQGENPPYNDVDFKPISGTINILPDEFFGKGLATAVKEYLKMKGRAATAQEIFDALKRGGFEWSKDWSKEHRLKNLAISLSKNRNDFILVPVGDENAYGLWDFYPNKKREKEKQQTEEIKEAIKEENNKKEQKSGRIAAIEEEYKKSQIEEEEQNNEIKESKKEDDN